MLHTIRHQAFQEILFGFMAFEIEFVMNLNDHSGHQSFFLNAFLDTDHSHFYNIGSRSLYRSIDGISFRHPSDYGIPGVYVPEITSAAHNCFDKFFFSGFFDGFFHVFFHAWIKIEITVDQFFAFFAADVESFGQAPGRYTVYDTEISCFSPAAHFRSYFL